MLNYKISTDDSTIIDCNIYNYTTNLENLAKCYNIVLKKDKICFNTNIINRYGAIDINVLIDIQNKLISFGSLYLRSLKVLHIKGDDQKIKGFLQGQVSSDINELNNLSSQLSCICNQKGLVMAGFLIQKVNKNFKIIKK